MLRTPDGFLQEGSKVFRPTPADKRIIRALLQAAQTKAKDVELDVVWKTLCEDLPALAEQVRALRGAL